MKIRYFFCIILVIVLAVSCADKQEEEEQNAKKTVINFLSAVNNGNYTLLFDLSHKNFLPYAQMIREIGNDHVRFKKINLLYAKIEGDSAEISVEVEDFNGYFFIMDWLLVKENERWKIFHLNYYVFLFDRERFDAVQYSDEGIYMPENDPNMIPY